MLKKAIILTSLILIDGVFSFIVFFLFVIGFGTMPKIAEVNYVDDPIVIHATAKQYLYDTSPMFIIELLVCLAIIFISNYFLLRVIAKRPFYTTLVICAAYLAIFISFYFYLCHEFIQRNL